MFSSSKHVLPNIALFYLNNQSKDVKKKKKEFCLGFFSYSLLPQLGFYFCLLSHFHAVIFDFYDPMLFGYKFSYQIFLLLLLVVI